MHLGIKHILGDFSRTSLRYIHLCYRKSVCLPSVILSRSCTLLRGFKLLAGVVSSEICIMFGKNSLFIAWLLGISANLNENYRHYNFKSFANIFGKFPDILNFRKIYNPTFGNISLPLRTLAIL